MTINYGKRDPGGLTAASPGDTLYIPFATYQDSGASIGIGGSLAVSDVEIFKNGNAVPRATDSGYSLISDTGQYGNRVGLHRFSISLFNTSDDTGFFDAGSQYHVAVDSITVDGRTVRFFPAVFEIGTPRANVVEVAGDTGAATHLAQMGDEYDTGRLQADVQAIDGDTGAADQLSKAFATMPTYFQQVDVQQLDADTGNATQLGKFASILSADGQIDTGTGAADTGVLSNSVWNSLKASHGDTGSFGEELAGGVNVAKIVGDTGAAAHLAQLADEYDTGRLPAEASATLDTGAINQAVWQADATRVLTANTNLAGLAVNVTQINSDTGAAVHLGQMADEYDTGRLPAEASATLDTGAISNAVWNSLTASHGDTGTFGENLGSILTASFDTGAVSNAVWNSLKADHGDTGTFGEEIAGGIGGSASVDTGQINRAVWQGDASRTLTAWTFDTGVQQKLDRLSNKVDTGVPASVWASATRTLTAFSFDTGIQQKLDRNDTGVRSAITQLSAKADTGVPASVWASATRTLTAFAFDTGIQQKLDRLDTGMSETIDAIKTQTDKLTFDTGANELHADIRKVANVQIQGTGDTGLGDTWRPV